MVIANLHEKEFKVMFVRMIKQFRRVDKQSNKLDIFNKKKMQNLLVAQSYLTLCDPLACLLPGSSVHGIFQARTLEWVDVSFSKGSS